MPASARAARAPAGSRCGQDDQFGFCCHDAVLGSQELGAAVRGGDRAGVEPVVLERGQLAVSATEHLDANLGVCQFLKQQRCRALAHGEHGGDQAGHPVGGGEVVQVRRNRPAETGACRHVLHVDPPHQMPGIQGAQFRRMPAIGSGRRTPAAGRHASQPDGIWRRAVVSPYPTSLPVAARYLGGPGWGPSDGFTSVLSGGAARQAFCPCSSAIGNGHDICAERRAHSPGPVCHRPGPGPARGGPGRGRRAELGRLARLGPLVRAAGRPGAAGWGKSAVASRGGAAGPLLASAAARSAAALWAAAACSSRFCASRSLGDRAGQPGQRADQR